MFPDQNPTIRQVGRKIIERRNRPGGRDHIKKQLDGVAPPTPFISPEHYHVSYEIDGKTYPNMERAWKRSRGAYMELWRLASLSKEEPVFYDEGVVMVTTPMKGRTGLFRFLCRVVECLLPSCARYVTIALPAVAAPRDSAPYVQDQTGLFVPKQKRVPRIRTGYSTQSQDERLWK